jgi:hypothetical protein
MSHHVVAHIGHFLYISRKVAGFLKDKLEKATKKCNKTSEFFLTTHRQTLRATVQLI